MGARERVAVCVSVVPGQQEPGKLELRPAPAGRLSQGLPHSRERPGAAAGMSSSTQRGSSMAYTSLHPANKVQFLTRMELSHLGTAKMVPETSFQISCPHVPS